MEEALAPDAVASPPRKKSKKEKKKAGMDMSRYEQRCIALWISYEGGAYSGFAEQNIPGAGVDTVERQLFAALKKTCLVESRESCGYSRCGRTDKGVSALGQVVGLRVRSAARAGEPVGGLDFHAGDALAGGRRELDYVNMLNRVLPDDVRALAWRPVVPEFSARFSCASRTYRYFFPATSPNTGAAYDVPAMAAAAARLVGDHDFRNFCKMDVLHVKNFRRVVYAADVRKTGDGFFFEIHGQAFLWHMVRRSSRSSSSSARGSSRRRSSTRSWTSRGPRASPSTSSPTSGPSCSTTALRHAVADAAPLPEPLDYLATHFEGAYRAAVVEAAKRRNDLERLDAFAVRRSDLDALLAENGAAPAPPGAALVPWPAARALLRGAADAKLRAAHTPLLDRETGKSYEEKVTP
ncbi:hypothetical protein JL720_15327 [Aureococcus anophagefferens]|nr:hypothetical protein JL720_15327 [Aureococcus anophagefferens]